MPFSVDGYNAFGPESLSAIASVVAVLWLFGTLPVSRMRASELVAASALGFVIGITFISSESSFQGVAAILGLTFILCGLRMADRWRAKSSANRGACLVFYGGSFLKEALAEGEITEQQVVETVRAHGYRTLGDISAVVWEDDATFTIIPREELEPRPTLQIASSNILPDD